MTFKDGASPIVNDPCTLYNSGFPYDNSGFVIDDPAKYKPVIIEKLNRPRLPPKDLVIYELMLDDFTVEPREVNNRSWVDVIANSERLAELKALGVNAIEFMPWTAWPGNDFSRGYDPFLPKRLLVADDITNPSE